MDIVSLAKEKETQEMNIADAVESHQKLTAVDEQIRDLQQLAEIEDESMDESGEDSDEEDMRRITTNQNDSDEEMEGEYD